MKLATYLTLFTFSFIIGKQGSSLFEDLMNFCGWIHIFVWTDLQMNVVYQLVVKSILVTHYESPKDLLISLKYWILTKFLLALIFILVIQSSHNFAHIMTAELSLSWQLSCHYMCKIMTWLDRYFSQKSNIYFQKVWIIELTNLLWNLFQAVWPYS